MILKLGTSKPAWIHCHCGPEGLLEASEANCREVKLQKAMEQVKLILETEKCAVVPSQEHHGTSTPIWEVYVEGVAKRM